MNPTRRQALKTIAFTAASVATISALPKLLQYKKLSVSDLGNLKPGDRVLVRSKATTAPTLGRYIGQHVMVVSGPQLVLEQGWYDQSASHHKWVVETSGSLESWNRTGGCRELGVPHSCWLNQATLATNDAFLMS